MAGFQASVTGESISAPLKVGFDRRLKLQFHGAKLSSDGGLLLFRELDDALGLDRDGSWELRDNRTGKNSRHNLLAMFRQSVFGRVASYDDVNDAGRLARDPVMRLITGQRDFDRPAASESQMGRFETGTLVSKKNLTALTDLERQVDGPDSAIAQIAQSDSGYRQLRKPSSRRAGSLGL